MQVRRNTASKQSHKYVEQSARSPHLNYVLHLRVYRVMVKIYQGKSFRGNETCIEEALNNAAVLGIVVLFNIKIHKTNLLQL